MNQKIFAITAMIFLILIPIALSDTKSILPWYDIEEWELEVCEKWGGVQGVNNAVNTINTFLAETTIAVQGKKIPLPNGQFHYEYSYYLHPYSGSMEFALRFASSTANITKPLVERTTVGEAGISGFNVMELPEEFDQIQLSYGSGILKMPLIGEDGGYKDTASPSKGGVQGAEALWET